MKAFDSFSIRKKLLASFGVVIALVLIMAVVGYFQLSHARQAGKHMVPDSMQMRSLQEFAVLMASLESNLDQAFVTGGQSFKEGALHDAQELFTVLESLKAHTVSEDRPSSQAIIQDLDMAISQLGSETSTLLEADSTELSSREVNEQIISAHTQIATVNLLHNELTEETLLQVSEIAVGQEATISSVITQFLVLTISVVLAGIVIAVVLSSFLSRPIRELKKSADEIARGNLDIEIEPRSRDEIGELAFAFSTMASNLNTELTERKKAEEVLRQSEGRFRSFTENAPDFVMQVGRDGTIQFINRTHEGLSQEDVVGSSVLSWFPGDHAPAFERALAQVFEMAQAQVVEHLAWDQRGEKLWYSSNLGPIGERGNVTSAIVVSRDITDRKRAEEALKEYSDRLEEMVEERTKELREAQEQLIRKEKLATLGQLAGGVAHELRNPLGAIKNAAYYLNMVLKKPEPDVRESLEIMNQEIAASEKIISSLIDVGSPKERIRQSADLNDVVRKALSRASVPSSVEVISQLDETLPAIPADPDQLGQVFGNIILNAAQALPNGGHLTIKSEILATGQVIVSVADTGVGMAADTMANIFEPLFTTKAKGMGLGLALAKSLVEAHGGTIRVKSRLGEGTTFAVELPMVNVAEADGPGGRPPPD